MPVWLVPILKTLGTNLLLTLMERAVNELKKRDNSVSEEDVKLVQSVRRNNIFNTKVKGSAGRG
jgi:hypothetical protein